MAYHHLALATRDMPATHVFYTRAMGFELVKVEVAPTPEGGYAKHFFYDTGNGEMMAFWELHDVGGVDPEFPTAMSRGVGLPPWVNHVAFHAESLAELEARRKHWVESGYDVLEVDHDWCVSVYATDPNGNMVEWCVTTGEFSQADRDLALRAVTGEVPLRDTQPKFKVYRAELAPVHERERP